MTHPEFQSKFGIVLPDAYLRHAEQGSQAESLILSVDPKYEQYSNEYGLGGPATVQMSSLLYLDTSLEYASMPALLEMLRNYRDLPTPLFPIATCWNGDSVLCDVGANSARQDNAVFFWDHESGEIMPLCRTLEEFYAALQKPE